MKTKNKITLKKLKYINGKEFDVNQIDEFVNKYKLIAGVNTRYFLPGKDEIYIKLSTSGQEIGKFIGDNSLDKYVFEINEEKAKTEIMLLDLMFHF